MDAVHGGLPGCQTKQAGSSSEVGWEPGEESSSISRACAGFLSALQYSHGTQGRVSKFLGGLEFLNPGFLWIVSHRTLKHKVNNKHPSPPKKMQSGRIFLPKENQSSLPSCYFFFSPSVSKPSCPTVDPNSENQKQTRLLLNSCSKIHRAHFSPHLLEALMKLFCSDQNIPATRASPEMP